MKNLTVAGTVVLLVAIVVSSVFAAYLIDTRIRWIPGTYLQVPDHVNVPVYCEQGRYLADHYCVSICPWGFGPGDWFTVSPPVSFSGSPCMTSDGRPVSLLSLIHI